MGLSQKKKRKEESGSVAMHKQLSYKFLPQKKKKKTTWLQPATRHINKGKQKWKT